MRTIFIGFLLFSIATIFGYLIFFTAFNTKLLSNINDNYRDNFARHGFLKNAFSLDQVGDASADLLNEKHRQMNIIVVDTDNYHFEAGTSDYLLKEISKIVGYKNVNIETISKSNIQSYDEYRLEKVAKQIDKTNAIQNKIIILVFGKSEEFPTRVGMTLNDRTILLFKGRIGELSETGSVIDELEQSTILHEFGHLIGLEHNDKTGCLMNTAVESPGNNVSENLPLTFCGFEREQIKKIRNGID